MKRTLALILSLLLPLALAGGGPLLALEERSVAPGINAPYEAPNWSRWVATFEREGREVYDRRFDILRALDLEPGAVVADVGAGTGLFTRLMAEAVGPEGKVYAVDISPTFVENTVRSARAAGLTQVEGVVNEPRDVRLPAQSVDLVFISDTYHHFEYPLSTLRSIHRALKPDGEMGVIDFKRIPGVSSPWVMQHVRAGRETFIREIESAGFELVGEEPIMQTQYFLRFRKS
jgi:predicted methyltransferase